MRKPTQKITTTSKPKQGKPGRSPVIQRRAKPTHGRTAAVPTQPTVEAGITTSKLSQVLDAISVARGATISELVTLTGWQPHTTRAALSRLRQRGLQIDLHKEADRKAYHLTRPVM